MVAAVDFFTSWITPTSLFLFVNLVIGTIAITSRFSRNTTSYRQDEQQLQPLTRASSLLYRLKSIDYSFYKLPPQETNTVYAEPETTVPVERAPSFLERVKSFKISDYLHNTDPELEDERKEVVGSDHHVTRSLSEPSEHKVNEKKLKKWGSEKEVMVAEKDEIMEEVEKRRPATMRLDKTVSFGDEEVNEKADDFINKFKQQLKMQRLDSLIRYRDMLRGQQKT